MNDRAQCHVCPHECHVAPGRLGLCGARGNVDGKILDLNYGKATALALDPIEKKPLAMYMPGSKILSYGSYGCNLKCPFCQNSDISMACANDNIAEHSRYISPENLVQLALDTESKGNVGIAFTYNEPLIAPEYISDCSKLLHEHGLKCICVTNGYISDDVFGRVSSLIDAANIDLKCFIEEGYEKVGAKGGLEIVKRNIETAYRKGVHVEITTLVVPGISDDIADFKKEVEWISSIDPTIPLHISRFFPQYRMNDSHPTSLDLMEEFYEIASSNLSNVFMGNV